MEAQRKEKLVLLEEFWEYFCGEGDPKPGLKG